MKKGDVSKEHRPSFFINQIKKKKGICHRHPIFINLKSNTMKNTVQMYDFCVI